MLFVFNIVFVVVGVVVVVAAAAALLLSLSRLVFKKQIETTSREQRSLQCV